MQEIDFMFRDKPSLDGEFLNRTESFDNPGADCLYLK